MEHDSRPASRKPDAPVLFVLMGASNLHRGHVSLVEGLTRSLSPRKVKFLTALGPGRAYCAEGGMLSIRYPAIGTCGIVEAAKRQRPAGGRVVALVTDIGSDIMYNVPVATICSTLERIFQELMALDADVFVTEIPVDMKRDVSPLQFTLIKRLFYPFSPLRFETVGEAVESINAFVRRSAKGRVHLLPNMQPHCGWDKIHYATFQCHRVWNQVAAELLAALDATPARAIGPGSIARSMISGMSRLLFCDFVPIRKKAPGLF